MMRKLLTAVLFVALGFSVAPLQARATVGTAQDEAYLLKKKKLAQAAEEKKKAAVAAKLKAARQKEAKLKAEKLKVARRDCGTFFQCLFAKPRRSASASGLSGKSMRKQVAWKETKYAPGTLIVKTPERALYYVLGDGAALRYAVGVGREGFQWGGNSRIVAKAEWPSWTPPQTMIEREAAKGHIIPPFMKGGPGNPLGARAMYIGGTIYRVHGTNAEASIGGAVSSGCIRMMNADVIDLYERVTVGTPIYVYQ